MKFTKMLAILLPVLVGIPALSGCKSEDKPIPPTPGPVEPEKPEVKPMSINEFFETIGTKKNYTYTYEYFERKNEESEFKTIYKYEDRFTNYGMHSKAIIETSSTNSNIAWASDEKDGTYSLIIDENGNVTPGRAIRDGNRQKIRYYYDQVTALDDLTVSDLDASLYQKKDNYRIKSIEAKASIIEATQLNPDAAKESTIEIILNLENSENITLRGDFGKNRYFVGSITNIGKTEIPEIKSYIESGKGPFVQTKVDPTLQGIIDNLNTFNYTTNLFGEVVGDERPSIGTTKVYKKVIGDKTAIVKFNDYTDEQKVDDGLIEIQTVNEHCVYNFTLVDGAIKLGKAFQIKDTPITSFMDDYCYELPNSLSAFNEDAIIFDYDTINKMFVTYDTYVTVELCVYFDLVYSLDFSLPLCTVINPIFGNNGLETMELRYYWQDQAGNQPYTSTFFQDFGKVNLPFVDTFLEAR